MVMSVQTTKCALVLSITLIASSFAFAPRLASACWSESGSCTGDRMEFEVACNCSGGTCDIYDQCYDCDGARLDGGDSENNTSDEYMYDLSSSSCSNVTAKNLGRTPSTYHPRLKAPVNVTTGNVAYQETDFRVKTPGLDIVFTRTWNSQGAIDEDLGDSWIHSYGWYVDDYQTYGKIVVQGDGRTHYYNCEDANDSYSACDGDGSEDPVYVAHAGPAAYMTLTEDADEYILTFDHGQVVYYFDKDKDNRLWQIDHPNGNNITITFDSADSDIDKIQSRHDTTVYAEVDVTTDANHRITSIDDAEGNTYTYSYTSGRLSSRAYPSSLGTRYYYYGDQNDINGTTVDLDDGGDADNLTWVKDERSKIDAVFSYDTSDRCDYAGVGVVSNEILLYHEFDYATPSTGQTTVKGPTISGSQRSTVMTWKSWFGIGAVTAASNSGCGSCGGVGYWSSRSYDINLNPLESDSQDSVTTRWEYDSDGLVTKLTEAAGDTEERVTEYTYNSTWEKVATVKVPSVYGTGNQMTTTYTWDSSNGDLSSVQQSGYDHDGSSISRTWTYTRDSLRRVTRLDGPLTAVNDYTDYVYWASGNGDKSYRLKRESRRVKDSPTTSLVIRYYDDYDDNGNLLEARDSNLIKTKYTYNAVGWLTEKHTIIGAEESCSTTTTDHCWEYTYLANGLLDELELPENNVLDYTYDDGNRRTKMERKNSSAGSDIDYVSYGWNRENTQTKKQYYTGSDTETWVEEYDYDVYWRRTKIKLPDEDGGEGTDEISFVWGNDNTLTSRSDARDNTTAFAWNGLGQMTGINLPGIGSSGDDYTYTYENVGVLEQITDPNDHDNDYVYDDFGNVRKVTTPDSGTYTFTFNKAGKCTQRTHTAEETVSYTYDNMGRLTKVDYPVT